MINDRFRWWRSRENIFAFNPHSGDPLYLSLECCECGWLTYYPDEASVISVAVRDSDEHEKSCPARSRAETGE